MDVLTEVIEELEARSEDAWYRAKRAADMGQTRVMNCEKTKEEALKSACNFVKGIQTRELTS